LEGNQEAYVTLTHVSMQGETLAHGGKLATPARVTITPAYVNILNDAPPRATKCEISVPEGNEAARLATTLDGRHIIFTVEPSPDGGVNHRFSFNFESVADTLAFVDSLVPHIIFSSPRFWLALEKGPNVDPVMYVEAVEGNPTDLEVHQYLVVEEGQPPRMPFPASLWEKFQNNLMGCGDFVHVHFHPDDENGSFYIEAEPTHEASQAMEALVHTIAHNCPRPPQQERKIPQQRTRR